jgi:dihydrodipicolinate synthase/N-acetylneuraminate lyase
MGLIDNEMRLPMVPLSSHYYEAVRNALGEAGCI